MVNSDMGRGEIVLERCVCHIPSLVGSLIKDNSLPQLPVKGVTVLAQVVEFCAEGPSVIYIRSIDELSLVFSLSIKK